MASTDTRDPFQIVESDVQSQLSQTRPLFKSYLRIRSLTTPATYTSNPELKSAISELEESLQILAEDLSDLVESVEAIENDPRKFGLKEEEVTRRKKLVQDVGNEVEGMRKELQNTTSNNSSDGRYASSMNEAEYGHRQDDEDDEDAYGEFEQQQQERIMQEQDTQLDSVFRTVGNIRAQADEMGRELHEQGELLDDVDNLADRVGGRLSTGVEKLKWVMEHNEDRWSGICIWILIFVLILLLVLVLVL